MYTYPAIEYLAQLDFGKSTVLEFGSGQSTLWWSRRVEHVTAVEHDDHWVSGLVKRKLRNLTCLFVKREEIATGEKYLAVLPDKLRFDVIALDGLHYYDCAKAARDLLNPGGLSFWTILTVIQLPVPYCVIMVFFKSTWLGSSHVIRIPR